MLKKEHYEFATVVIAMMIPPAAYVDGVLYPSTTLGAMAAILSGAAAAFVVANVLVMLENHLQPPEILLEYPLDGED